MECNLNFYNVLEKTERNKCLEDLAVEIVENDNATRKIVVIMGGDGSFATTIKFLRTSKEVDAGLNKGKLCFATLPFGTGNDGGQAFGWGNNPSGELWFDDLEALMRDLVKAQCINLSLWNCRVDGVVLSASGEKLDNNILMVYYFNLGLDARIGMEVERNRKSTRCCNYIMYAFYVVRNYFNYDYMDARNQIKKVTTQKTLPNGLKQEKVVTDMKELRGAPFNVVGYNLNSGYGNIVFEKTWEKSAERIMDPNKVLRNHKLNIMETSCDESDSKLVQRIDDDKIEIMCHESLGNFIDGQMGRLGQVRSPFDVQFEESFETENR